MGMISQHHMQELECSQQKFMLFAPSSDVCANCACMHSLHFVLGHVSARAQQLVTVQMRAMLH
eukprot:1148712-Pelagomonas_calceolata.AAC.9